ncbi:MAG TPA: EF-P beta-lysylation protein EpmB [Pseudomonadales bacterium]|jgi:EF-P beta-lysylation protein EpmB|nr:EF-P beta-lysylation protein EpmB [Pseudomonadales bacterium]
MIPVSHAACQDWQSLLRNAISDPNILCQRLALQTAESSAIALACQNFPLRVPEPYLERIEIGNPRDPLLLQILPQTAELLEQPGFVSDPLDESAHNPVPGLVHKYGSRVLLISTSLCAVHCRYCFRREFPYQDNRNSRLDWQQALHYIRQHSELNEVILSGGDPLTLPDKQLAWLIEQVVAVPHIVRLRIHTRLPVVIPQRITRDLLHTLTHSRLQTVVVLHCNHPNEIDAAVSQAISGLRSAGITVLNQSVLLASINDCSATLAALSERLFAAGCLPYYLHALDKVRGAHHFAVDDQTAVQLHRELQALLPGFLVPRLVRENAGESSKTWLA